MQNAIRIAAALAVLALLLWEARCAVESAPRERLCGYMAAHLPLGSPRQCEEVQ